MEKLQVFNHPKFGAVRVIAIGGEPYFVGMDIALMLGYKSYRGAIARHVDEEDRRLDDITTDTGIRKMVVVNAAGMYSLVFCSRYRDAMGVKRWITQEVLPNLRRQEIYSLEDMLADPDMASRIIRRLSEEKGDATGLPGEKALQWQMIAEMNPRVSYYDVILNCSEAATAAVIARDYGWNEEKLNSYLQVKGIQRRCGNA